MTKIKDLIKKMRESERLTHSELSKFLKSRVTSARVKNWESGETDLRATQFEEICEVLGYEITVRKIK
ncbi:MAG: helix-turn-helix transcriptional regulator [Bacteroidales bacterium]|uniref:helix-turn-helix domain-containing protein n=1 Tax=Porphyromonas sp. TaxID=1924944 RepID=UPI002978423E|nr:helix-turn-helix transcriptional regulator [Porphyromonas sp.]MDD7437879.1 helix-turn-helix transcriptional regulator [Bacteroidales bacterium]MDY3066378.1 helix-turn-helix transcriptional regulator [Porphyromonas sp.]